MIPSAATGVVAGAVGGTTQVETVAALIVKAS